jgi:hypothetical protein
MIFVRSRQILSCLLAAAFLLTAASLSGESLAEKKANFLYDFTKSKYIQWSEGAVEESFTIGVLQDSMVYRALQRLTGRKMFLFRKSVEAEYFRSLEAVKGCHILYFDRQVPYSVQEILNKIGQQPILLVGSNYPFNKVMVNFMPVEEELGIDVNSALIRQQGLTPTDKLLELRATSEQQWNQMLEKAKQKLEQEKEKLRSHEERLQRKEDTLQRAVERLEERKERLQERTLELKHLHDALLSAREKIEKKDIVLMENT